LTFAELCSELVKEPWNLTLADIGRLTVYQTKNIYFRPRDRFGRLIRVQTEDEVALPPEVIFRRVWKGRGLADAEIDERWKAHQAELASHAELMNAVLKCQEQQAKTQEQGQPTMPSVPA